MCVGLERVVKHKLWVEVIKALKLPASATSAAFALRLHYLHLLYAFEQKSLHNVDVPPSQTPAPAVQIKREREGSRGYVSQHCMIDMRG